MLSIKNSKYRLFLLKKDFLKKAILLGDGKLPVGNEQFHTLILHCADCMVSRLSICCLNVYTL